MSEPTPLPVDDDGMVTVYGGETPPEHAPGRLWVQGLPTGPNLIPVTAFARYDE